MELKEFFERILREPYCWGFVHLKFPSFPMMIYGARSKEEACRALKSYVEHSLKKEFNPEEFLFVERLKRE